MELSVNQLANVIFRAGPRRNDNGLYVAGRLLEGSKFNRRIAVPTTISSDDYRTVISEPVYYLGVLYSCWGNCITDNLKFLWPLIEPERHPFLKNCKFAYSEVKLFDKPLPENFWKILRMFGITDDRLVKVSENTLLSHCLLADESYVQDDQTGQNYATQEYDRTIEFICQNCLKNGRRPSSRKIYFTRSRWHRWEFGEKSVEEVFRRAGYSIASPETLSLEEMVACLQEATDFAATDGSCAHNSVFLRPGTRAVFLRKFDSTNEYQQSINAIRRLNATYIDANLSRIFYDDKDKLGGPFFIYPSKALCVALQCRGKFPFVEYARYLSYALVLHYGHLAGEFMRRTLRKSPEHKSNVSSR